MDPDNSGIMQGELLPHTKQTKVLVKLIQYSIEMFQWYKS